MGENGEEAAAAVQEIQVAGPAVVSKYGHLFEVLERWKTRNVERRS